MTSFHAWSLMLQSAKVKLSGIILPTISASPVMETTMKRRHLLTLLPAALLVPSGLLLPAYATRAETEFERYKRQQQAGVDNLKRDWQRYRSNYRQAYRSYQRKVSTIWASPELSGKTQWVEYGNDLKTKRVVDFERNEVRLSFTNIDGARLSEQRIRAEFEKVIAATIGKSYQHDPVLGDAAGKQVPTSADSVTQIAADDINRLLEQAKQQQETTRKGDVITVTIPLNADAVPQRAQGYLPTVKAAARKWNVPVPLVLAIMQTESAFNPMARSHIPAFGLMQIVPGSAGRDASKHAYGRERLLSGSELFQPETNIELGCAYLNLLDTRYLKAINNAQSRLFCTIAAYNTGAGNVARAFSGNTSVSAAAKRINAMTPAQVYAHLRQNLKYEEARNYIYKVTQAMPAYQA